MSVFLIKNDGIGFRTTVFALVMTMFALVVTVSAPVMTVFEPVMLTFQLMMVITLENTPAPAVLVDRG